MLPRPSKKTSNYFLLGREACGSLHTYAFLSASRCQHAHVWGKSAGIHPVVVAPQRCHHVAIVSQVPNLECVVARGGEEDQAAVWGKLQVSDDVLVVHQEKNLLCTLHKTEKKLEYFN